MRKLASIKRISDLKPIEGKDRIVLATVDGWSVIVQKADFEVGSQCVYIEIDSVLPEKPEFEFLRKNGFRIKTMRMAGCISQGICFPLSILPAGSYKDDQDVTELIGVTQYIRTMDDAEENILESYHKQRYPKFLMRFKWFRKLVRRNRQKYGNEFPSFITKTDEVRIQNVPQMLKDKGRYVFTEKMDGCSATYAIKKRNKISLLSKNKYEFIVCSRNRMIPVDDGSVYWKVAKKYNIFHNLKKIIGDCEWIYLQGECIAPKIQKNKYHVDTTLFYAFNLVTPDGRYGTLDMEAILDGTNISCVPIVDDDATLPDTVDEMLELAHGTSYIYDTLREGLVCRSLDGSKSFKAVDPLFLMKWDE